MINGHFRGNHNIKSAVGGTMPSYLLTFLLEIKRLFFLIITEPKRMQTCSHLLSVLPPLLTLNQANPQIVSQTMTECILIRDYFLARYL